MTVIGSPIECKCQEVEVWEYSLFNSSMLNQYLLAFHFSGVNEFEFHLIINIDVILVEIAIILLMRLVINIILCLRI